MDQNPKIFICAIDYFDRYFEWISVACVNAQTNPKIFIRVIDYFDRYFGWISVACVNARTNSRFLS